MYHSERFLTLRALTKFLDKIDPPDGTWSFSVRGDGIYVLVWRDRDA